MRKYLGKMIKMCVEDWTHFGRIYKSELDEKSLMPRCADIMGIVVFENDKFISLAMEVFDNDQYREVGSVPRTMIKKITVLEESKKRVK